MKVLVTGASGQLGYDVCRELTARGVENCGVSSKEMDITDPQAVLDFVMAYKPDMVIHCAAYTKVDQAEEEAEKAFAVNGNGTRNIAQACQKLHVKMLYISTDYVFPGTGEQFYEVDDPKGPLNVYGKSKLEGELAVQELLEQYFIVRISWVFGEHGNNFVKTMLRLAEQHQTIRVVDDQVGSPTYTRHAAQAICDIINSKNYGIYHLTNSGICSWAEFAREIFHIANRSVSVIPIASDAYPTKAVRPHNSRLSKSASDALGWTPLPDWRTALYEYLGEIDAL